MSSLAQYITPTILIPIVVLAAIFCFIAYYWYALTPRKGTLEWVSMASTPRTPLAFAAKRYPMEKKDALPLFLLTGVYAITAFWGLGTTQNPQTVCQIPANATATLTLTQEVSVSRLLYYTGLNTGTYTLEVSSDGRNWMSLWSQTDEKGNVLSYYWADGTGYAPSRAMTQKYSELFKWIDITTTTPAQVRYIRVTALPDAGRNFLELGELALFDQSGARVGADLYVASDSLAARLVDEQDTVPQQSTWFNSTYFDEIYHPRTAMEHIMGMNPYEITHPPLGKLTMGLGIEAFGMTPFGWRFMGTLFGILMVPLLYVFLKNLFGKTLIAACGSALFAFDFMHLTQTRIATIDTYGVFYILAMYFFLYRYLTVPPGAAFRKGALPLFLSGLMWGLGAASKWTVIYGAVGLAILYFVGLYMKWRDWPRDSRKAFDTPFTPWLIKTLLFSVLCFVVIPAVIYTLSYWPYAVARGDTSLSGLVNVMVDNQKYMFGYHQGVHDAHPYESRWFQWIVNGRPILYYMDNTPAGFTGRIAAFSNPVVCWTGLLALLLCAAQSFRRKVSKAAFFLLSAAFAVVTLIQVNGILDGALDAAVRARNIWLLVLGVALYLGYGAFATLALPKCSAKAIFITVGYFSQLVPWLLIGRTTFEYHYFPSIIFLVLAIAYLFNDLAERGARYWKGAAYAVTGGAVACYAIFYPVLVGIKVPSWYSTNVLQWLPSWPF